MTSASGRQTCDSSVRCPNPRAGDTYLLGGGAVRARGVIQSPVLVGRDSYLALVETSLAGASEGAGRLLFVAGEAGIGKTRLLGSAARRAQASGFTVARGAAFPG